MAFVLTGASSPSPREIHPQIGDIGTSPHVNQTPVSHFDHDMGRDKDHKPRLEILLDSSYIYLKGVGVDVEPARLSGHVALYLTESTSIKEITLQFRGKARLPIPSSESLSLSTHPLTYMICTHDWSFLEGQKKNRSHTLKAGRHLFPFQLQIGGSLPSTTSTRVFGGASVAYKLCAQAVRTGFNQNLQAALPVPILRSFSSEALEYQQTLEIENTWPDKLMYQIMVPHKAWAAGDKVTALVKFSPLTKGVYVLSVNTSIHEQTKVYARSGAQENVHIAATAKHEIVGSRAVEVDPRSRHRRTASGHASLPVSPASASSLTTPAHNTTDSSSGRHYFSRTPVSTPPTRPDTPIEPESTESEPENSDVVTYISIPIPLTVTPTSNLEPIIVSHRIRWSILILNLDGHTSELRCSLPLHILDYRLLAEARSFSAATRRLLLGCIEVPPEQEEDSQLPSYKAHVRDRVANMFLPESATMRVTNPWVSQGASPTYSQDSTIPIAHWPMSRSGRSTPLEAHLLPHLPHAPGSGASTPLDWVNSELLLSLSEEAPPSLSPDPHTPAESNSDSESMSRSISRPSSGRLSRFSSRATSPERERDRHPGIDAAHIHVGGPHETYLHSGTASRHLHSLFQTSLKPFSSFSHNHWMPRPSHSTHSSVSSSDLQRMSMSQQQQQQQPRTVTVPMPDPHSGSALLHRAFTEVPDYTIASRGFIGGVPPLSSMRGLPSYEETQAQRSQSDSDLAARFAQLGAGAGAGRIAPPPLTHAESS